MSVTSKVKTAMRLLGSGEFGQFWHLAMRNAHTAVSDTRKVHIGNVAFRMYATANDDQFLIEDEREYRLLEFALNQRLGCVYDIGANVGLHTLFYSHVADRVVAFEPAPAAFARLSDNIRLNNRTNITTMNVALSDRTATLDFLDNGVGQTGTLITSATHAQGFRKIQVPAHRLDDLDLPAPDLLKIDCEGAEMQVLRGAEATLRKHRPKVHLEVHPLLGVSEDEVRAFLTGVGYAIDARKKGDEMHYLCSPQSAAAAT